AFSIDGPNGGYYEMAQDLVLKKLEDPTALAHHNTHTSIPAGVLYHDDASLIFRDDGGKSWRLPRLEGSSTSTHRIAREIATERDLFNAGGIIYELPARNAGGFSMVRPVASHPFH